jgi:predicted nucleic acid-binding protein
VRDPTIVVWWGAAVECGSALARLERSGDEGAVTARTGFLRLEALTGAWTEVAPSEALRRVATRLVRSHGLRPADALHLAAAIEAGGRQPQSLDFVCLDQRLAAAAAREGFHVLPD